MITSMLKAFFEAIGKFFGCKDTSIQRQAETDVIKTKRNLKKATDYAEKIIALIESDNCSLKFAKPRYYTHYQNLKQKFMRYN